MDNSCATLTSCSNEGCDLFCTHLLIVISDLPICSASQRLVLFCSARATLIRFIECTVILKSDFSTANITNLYKHLSDFDKYLPEFRIWIMWWSCYESSCFSEVFHRRRCATKRAATTAGNPDRMSADASGAPRTVRSASLRPRRRSWARRSR